MLAVSLLTEKAVFWSLLGCRTTPQPRLMIIIRLRGLKIGASEPDAIDLVVCYVAFFVDYGVDHGLVDVLGQAYGARDLRE